MPDDFYTDTMREVQDRLASRALADRLATRTLRGAFTEEDRAFIAGAPFFFIATADARGRPDCSFKGGLPGFVRVTAEDELAFPDWDGNGMGRTLGNILANPEVGLLFIRFGETPRRLRVNGRAGVSHDDPLMAEITGAQAIVRVRARHVFPNCPRYIPGEGGAPSRYLPRPGMPPEEPAWKGFDSFRDVVPPRAPARTD
jgi:hypothetical protein